MSREKVVGERFSLVLLSDTNEMDWLQKTIHSLNVCFAPFVNVKRKVSQSLEQN